VLALTTQTAKGSVVSLGIGSAARGIASEFREYGLGDGRMVDAWRDRGNDTRLRDARKKGNPL
jgi:hypothetical protein